MSNKILIKAAPAYLAVWAGLFLFRSAWAALLGFHLAILAALTLSRPRSPITLLFRSRNAKWIFINVLMGLAAGLCVFNFHSQFGLAPQFPERMAKIGLNDSTWPSFIVYFSIVNPFIEEYFWRADPLSATNGIQLIDLVYAGYHGFVLVGLLPPESILFAILCLTLVSWFWRRVRSREDGLLATVLGHMAADFSILLAASMLSQ